MLDYKKTEDMERMKAEAVKRLKWPKIPGLTIATILSEIRECLSSSNYISHFRSANSVDSIVLKMKNGQEYVLSIRENK